MKKSISMAVSLLLTGCVSAPLHEKSAGYVIAPSARAIGVIGYAEEWQPDGLQVACLEKKIGRLFDHPDKRMSGAFTRDGSPPQKAPFPLSDYFIRYCGVINDGKKLIVGKASHQSISPASRALSIPDTLELPPFGGGTFFFTVIFDPVTGKILNLSYSAPL